jgi:hypothetical protein
VIASSTTDRSSNSKYDTYVEGAKDNRTSISTSNGALIVTLGDTSDSEYVLNFKDDIYKNINKWVINVSSKYKNTAKKVKIYTQKFEMEFYLTDLYLAGDYDRITITKITGKEYEDIIKNLPKNIRILSDIYDIKYEKVTDGKTINYNNFKNYIYVLIALDNNRLGKKDINRTKISYITHYSPSVVSKSAVNMYYVDSNKNTVSGKISSPGQIAVTY